MGLMAFYRQVFFCAFYMLYLSYSAKWHVEASLALPAARAGLQQEVDRALQWVDPLLLRPGQVAGEYFHLIFVLLALLLQIWEAR